MKKTRLDKKFAELRKDGKKGFIAYIGAGDPTLEDTVDIVLKLEEAGVDLVELGLPFSDPLADGRVNQDAATRALDAGATFDGVMDCIRKIREKSQMPMIFYAYLNVLYARGFEKAMAEAAEAGIDGFLILDMPREESGPYKGAIKAANLNNIVLITPTTPEDRMEKIVKNANGFVYCVSREGVTGVRDDGVATGAAELVGEIKKHTDLPVALGFGIGTPEAAADAARIADAVVVGSAIVNKFHNNPHTDEGRADAAAFVAEMVRAVKEI
ncbi:tryptophan synthase subunit alpha [Tichowtungia aerotolerans]|uniref:Tryptophan synthase alpha chain n=1 Tax=Tichowtungia aerotolerans TaxID=2697043 RepID=A0A6P1LZL1_9BACT|nr:tryptophan synthase subunit alpha [Tichowtungia aerotolerans]QHI67979.1 tryptophan synthase subunit alpha [Tichowtungia aerotolerans]